MTSKKEKWKLWKVPYHENGSVDWYYPKEEQIYFTNYFSNNKEKINWQFNEPFKAGLKFVKMFHYAKTSTHAMFEHTETKAQYIMRNKDLEYCLKHGVLIHGVILGLWRFRKDAGRCSIMPIDILSKTDLYKGCKS